MTESLLTTPFYRSHVQRQAKMIDFSGWCMPLQYETGIIKEHLSCRKEAGLFDVSHMGRFIIKGANTLAFLQHVCSSNVEGLDVLRSQYTILPNENGGAIDDAYIYRFKKDEYLVVVNASNKEKDLTHLRKYVIEFQDVQIEDISQTCAMLSLQGPLSKKILTAITREKLPEPQRNHLSINTIHGMEVCVARTGYTGEPLCFELFMRAEDAEAIWDRCVREGAVPIGLGARDTLRLEAGLPLYGHEFGDDPDGNEIEIFSNPLASFAVSFSPFKGRFIGKEKLHKQFLALKRIKSGDYTLINDLPRRCVKLALLDKGVAREGAPILKNGKKIGYITSGTMVPYWKTDGIGIETKFNNQYALRPVLMGLVESTYKLHDNVEVEIRGKYCQARIVPYHLRSEAPPYCFAITHENMNEGNSAIPSTSFPDKIETLLLNTERNSTWRHKKCINLIPSEQSQSKIVKLLSIMDPVNRYAEHRKVKAFHDHDVFYYQGTDFIAEVETLLEQELRSYLGCGTVETRLLSGQMANATVFSALCDFFNIGDRKSEQRRIASVMNHHIIKGGHLSSQPMGALKDYIARDPKTEAPAVINFPVLADNPYKIDVDACEKLIKETQPELIILGKSVIIHREPVKEIKKLIRTYSPNTILMYDMAHVLGLVGPYFQEPFAEGADIVTGSTHKTFFGTQRGIVASNYTDEEPYCALGDALQRRAFPGAVSNHHLGTMLGLLMASYEMNHFKDDYQKSVINNSKAFARSLKECGLDVAGDPDVSFTETHQVIINVGYAEGFQKAKQLEENNIIVNYQASPSEESFSASGSLRLGVAEMTRFGMECKDFEELAQLIHAVITSNTPVKQEIEKLRSRFLEMRFCFSEEHYTRFLDTLYNTL